VALTLRAVGGPTTAEIAFLVPEATIAQRISRAKRTDAGAAFATPDEAERPARLAAVLRVLSPCRAAPPPRRRRAEARAGRGPAAAPPG
jgi:predicted RNA polymerase sigma factor